jgi:hypothetical protein
LSNLLVPDQLFLLSLLLATHIPYPSLMFHTSEVPQQITFQIGKCF